MKYTLLLLVTSILLAFSGWCTTYPPTSNFSVSPSTTVLPGTTVCFADQSTVPLLGDDITLWEWTFASQAPNYSTSDPALADPPCIVYNTVGSYQVCLKVTNPDGNNQSCQTINVVPPFDMGSNNGTTLTGNCGLYISDDGGQFGNYVDGQTRTMTLCTGNSQGMSLGFDLIDLVAGDYIEVYNGTNTSGLLLGTITSADNGTNPNVYGSGCITVVMHTDGAGNAQGFLAKLNCYNAKLINLEDGNTLTGVCGSSLFDSGYSTGNYQNNENSTVTLCADNPSDVLQFTFQNVALASGDQLNFYDAATGQTIYTTENADNGTNGFLFGEPLTVTGMSQCIIAEFISNGSGTSGGFNTSIDCVTLPSGCNGNPAASDNMNNATLICDFSAWCGTTSGFYGNDMMEMSSSSVFSGSIENNSWLSFVADATTASFNLTTNCSNVDDAIQVGIYDIDANENVTLLSPASINGGFNYTNTDGFSGSGVVNAQGLVPGNTYYIMIDGQGGDVCDYSLTAGLGVQLPDAQASADMTIPCAGSGNVSVVDLNGSTNVNWVWTWTGTSTGGPVTADQMDVSSFAPGTYTFTVEATNFSSCAVNPIEDQVLVTVEPCPLPVEIGEFKVIEKVNYNDATWRTFSELNNSHFLLEKSYDLIDWEFVSKINGAGNSQHELRYSFHDYQIKDEITYYKLTQVDFDGAQESFPIASVNRTELEFKIIQITNILGQEVDENYEGLRIILYEDGSIMRKYGK